ncbi:hypothetical protein K458DRAFT_411714, partial [Lentithecium fluviatile CBS 122367]
PRLSEGTYRVVDTNVGVTLSPPFLKLVPKLFVYILDLQPGLLNLAPTVASVLAD